MTAFHRLGWSLGALTGALLVSSMAMAADLQVTNAWIRLLPGGAPAGGYFEIRNDGGARVELIGSKSKDFGDIMLHESFTERGQSQMRHVDALELPPGKKLIFKPGSYHLMMVQPARKLAVGEKIPIILVFADGKEITAQFDVRGPSGK